MRGLSMVHSYSTLLLVYWCVRYNFSILGLIPLLVVNAVLSFVLAAHINSRREHCTVPVEAELVRSEHREAFRPPYRPVSRIHWMHDVWRYRWGDDVCFAEDTIPLSCPCSGRSWASDARAPFGWTRPVRRTQRTGASCPQTGGTTCTSTMLRPLSVCGVQSRWLAAHSGELM